MTTTGSLDRKRLVGLLTDLGVLYAVRDRRWKHDRVFWFGCLAAVVIGIVTMNIVRGTLWPEPELATYVSFPNSDDPEHRVRSRIPARDDPAQRGHAILRTG